MLNPLFLNTFPCLASTLLFLTIKQYFRHQDLNNFYVILIKVISNGRIKKTQSTINEIHNTNKHKLANSNTTTLIRMAIALYNKSVHSTTKFKPHEVIFN